jgi:hypothetical protein
MIHVALVLTLARLSQEPQVSGPEVLRVGHVVEVRGALDEEGRFVAQKLELKGPFSDEVLIGTVPEGDTDPASFTLLGQPVETNAETAWEGLQRGSLAGQRIKAEGSWKGPTRFRAESIAPRGPGRDRIAARLDDLRRVEGGWEARVMIFTVLIADGTEVEHELALTEYGLAPERGVDSGERRKKIERDEDDVFGEGVSISDTLRLQGQLEVRADDFNNFDLRSGALEDRTDYESSARIRVTWIPSDSLVGQVEARFVEQYRRDDDNGSNDSENSHEGPLGETWLQWRDVRGHPGFDLTLGRQDFDDPREWIYDQNLDALRATWIRPDWRLDLSTATLVAGGGERDEASWNGIAYLSNNDEDRHLAAWTVYRDIDDVAVTLDDLNGDATRVELAERSLHFGVRALGEWIPQNESWAELAFELGDRDVAIPEDPGVRVGRRDVSAWAYDVGTTWSPPFLAPLYLSVGYALGSGDADGDRTFRQTGLQDNTNRFGGVTSFQYYGELFDPELSNLGILTLGAGARVAERTSLDLVFHTYTQDEARPEFSPQPDTQADIRQQPNGADADLGWEADLVFGYRRYRNWDLEIVAATFRPDDGFDFQDNAYYLKFQLRYRF